MPSGVGVGPPHLRGLEGRESGLSLLHRDAWPDVAGRNNLSSDPSTQQRETQPRRGLTFPSALPGPPHLRDTAHLAQRACILSREQLRSQPGPHDPAALLREEVRMTKVSDCKSMETPLRCH